MITDPGPEYGDDFRRFQGIPGIERAANGRLWATWYGGGEGENKYNYVLLSTSDDDGKTWEGIHLVVDPDGAGTVPGFDAEDWRRYHWAAEPRVTDSTRAYDPVVWYDPTGRLWLIWAQNSGSYWGTPATWAMTTNNPETSNPEWSKPFYIADGVMMNKPTVLESGEWLFPLAYWKEEKSCTVLATTDQGESWAFRGGATIPDSEHRNADEHMIVERGDGSLLMWVRTNYGIGESVSRDGGKTWTRVKKAPVEHPTARFFLRRLQSGNLLLVKHGPLTERTGRLELTAFLSKDDGQTWEGGLVFEERSCSYPDGVQDPDGQIFIIYDRSRRAHKEILLASFTEADVLAGKPVSGKADFGLLVNQAHGANLRNLELSDNRDAEPFVDGSEAVLAPIEGEVAELERGVLLFQDRDYRLHHLPPELVGRLFIKGEMHSTRASVVKGGHVTVLTPRPEVNPGGSLTERLESSGFHRVNLPDCSLFFGTANVCTAYQKKVETGDVLEFGGWGLLIF